MITPDLRTLFFENDFTDDMIPELDEAQKETAANLDKLSKTHKLTFEERDGIECSAAHETVMSQYLGFLQGFKWAVYLFTGHKESEEASR